MDSGIKEDIRQFLIESCAERGVQVEKIADDERILDSGIVDSLSLVNLVAFLEDRAGISVSSDDLVLENFWSIEKIVEFVEKSPKKS